MDERKVKRIYHPPTAPAADLFKGGKQRRVAAYARVSTASDEQLNSVEAQKDYFAKLIHQRPDWNFVGVYADATDIIGLKQNPTNGRRFSPIFFIYRAFFDTKRENATSKAKEEN